MTSLSDMTGIVGSCINCTTSANLLATLAVALVGISLAAHVERRKQASLKVQRAA
jgi:hypothetical protein